MPMQMIIPKIEIHGTVITEWECFHTHQTTLFIPSKKAVRSTADIEMYDISLLNDFIELGNFLFECYKEIYIPGFLSKLQNEHNAYENRLTWSELAVEKILCDSNSHYLVQKNNTVIEKVLSFINKYGWSTPEPWHNTIMMSQRVWVGWINKEKERHCSYVEVLGASFLIHELLDTFVSFCKPVYCKNKIVSLYGEKAYAECAAGVEFNIFQKYDPEKGKFITKCTVFGVLDYLSMMLSLINSGGSDCQISTCKNCGKSFLASNPRAVYCSPTCRNRANVKNCYYRRKKNP